MTWILTTTGRQHQLTGPKVFAPGNVPSLREIAHSLAQINRFTGHCSRPYSVAEHSLLVADIAKTSFRASPAVQLAALMHDAHECITGDVSSPIKQVLGAVWAEFEDAQQTNLLTQYGLADIFEEHHALIKSCDLMALATERRDMLPFDVDRHAPWPILDTPGNEVFLSGTDLNDLSRSMKTWARWAWKFEQSAADLMDEAKYELCAVGDGSVGSQS